MTLNSAQQAVVGSKAALRVVIAGPGSGKTRTLVEAVKASLRATHMGGRIAIMTFTNAGSAEFRHRLPLGGGAGYIDGEIVRGEPIKLVHCGTLHAYCFKLIQRFGNFLSYIPGKVAILPDKERIPRLLACRDKLGVKLSEKALLEAQTNPHPMPEKQSAGLVWREYEFLLKRNNLVDFDGILRQGYELLQMPPVRHQVQLDYLFIDEAHDSAAIDWEIYRIFPAMNKMIVLDPDQIIYSFRGASLAAVLRACTEEFWK